jgi:putative MATE family efflux protein
LVRERLLNGTLVRHVSLDKGLLGLVAKLAYPVVLANLLQATVGVIDIWMVSRLGTAATAAVGMSRQLIMVFIVLMVGLATGNRTIVAQFTGAERPEVVTRVAAQSIIVMLLVAVVLSAVGVALAPAMLQAVGADAELRALGVPYMQLFFALCIFMVFNFMFNAMLQGAGDMTTPLVVMVVINVIHVFFNYVFIYGAGPFPEMGVTGAALGTMTSRFVGTAIGLGVLFSCRFAVKLPRGTSFRPDWHLIWRMLRIGIPVAGQNLVRTLGNIGFLWVVTNSAVAGLQRDANVAAYSVGIQSEAFSFMPAMALAIVATTLVGQAQGAEDSGEAERRGWMTGLLGVMVMTAVGVVLFVFAPQIIAVFNEARDPLVTQAGISYLRINGVVEPFMALANVMMGALNGAGDTRAPLYYTVLAQWVLRLPLSYALVTMTGMGISGAWYAMALGTVVQGILTTNRFRTNQWKLMTV